MLANKILCGDALQVLKTLPENSVDSICCDPPAGISFMGKEWDGAKGGRAQWVAWLSEIMTEALRVTKPGGHAFVWALPKTSHWTACALEDAGWEIREKCFHIFACLSEDTEILTERGWEHYQTCDANSLALCYNISTDSFGWEPIKEVLIYDYNDTAYHIHSNHTDQIVSRNHRCIVERGGSQVFRYAETLQCEESVPVLEDLSGLLQALPLPYQGTSNAQSILRSMQQATPERDNEGKREAETRSNLSVLRKTIQAKKQNGTLESSSLFINLCGSTQTPKSTRGATNEELSQQGQGRVDSPRVRGAQTTYDGREESCMERRCDLLQEAWQLHQREVCTVPSGVSSNGTQGWICDGASLDCGSSHRSPIVEGGSGTSYRSQPNEQQFEQPATVCDQSGSQTVRASRFTRSDLATVTPIHYEGVVWCVRVPSGAFIARRNGTVFITGNSGFPKSHNISMAIDRMSGAEREVISTHKTKDIRRNVAEDMENGWDTHQGKFGTGAPTQYMEYAVTKPATSEAQTWDGWGTALKPAVEEWILCRKPLAESSVARNVLTWGTGGLNIDGCRIGTAADMNPRDFDDSKRTAPKFSGVLNGGKEGQYRSSPGTVPDGRWPAHLLISHTEECQTGACIPGCPVLELDEQSGVRKSGMMNPGQVRNQSLGKGGYHGNFPDTATLQGTYGDEGGASRFFTQFYYAPKASKSERNLGCEGLPEQRVARMGHGNDEPDERTQSFISQPQANIHPTVKNQQLMRWLCRLITPPSGVVLDCFAGSGSTGVAAIAEGFLFVGIELEPEYAAIASARLNHAIVEAEAEAKREKQLTLFEVPVTKPAPKPIARELWEVSCD